MATTTPNKTLGQTLLAHTQQATANITIGSAIDVSGKFSGRYYIALGRTIATALGNEVLFRLEASAFASGDEWWPIYQFTSGTCKTACQSTTLNGATTAGNTTAVLTSVTGMGAGSFLYFRETVTPANSEWARVKSIAGNTVTLEEAMIRNHTNAIVVSSFSEKLTGDIDFSSIGRIRLVVDSATAASGQTVDVLAWLVTFDSATTV